MAVMRTEIVVRFSDIDLMGHVNNVLYFDYLQEARADFIRRLYPGVEVDWHYVVVRHEIDYRRPINYQAAPVVIETWISRVGGASFTFKYRVLDEYGEICAEATSVLAHIDPSSGAAVRLPDEIRERFAEYVEAVDA